MKKFIIFLGILLFFSNLSFGQRVVFDRIIARVGGEETITLLEYEKMKSFLEEGLLLGMKTNLSISKEDVMKRILTEKVLLVIAKKMNIIVPDDEKFVNIINDQKVVDLIKDNPVFRKQIIGELRNQFIMSRIVSSDEDLKNYLQKEPDEKQLNNVLLDLYTKNSNQSKTIKVSFLLITTYLPDDLTLSQEKEIQSIFGEISNYIYSDRYDKALEVSSKKLGKYVVTNLTRYQRDLISLQKLYSEGIPVELLNVIGGVKLDQKLPIPLNYKVGDKLYTIVVKVISRKEESTTFEEFKSNILSVPELKNQVYSKIAEDKIKDWVSKSVSNYKISIDFLDSSYKVDL